MNFDSKSSASTLTNNQSKQHHQVSSSEKIPSLQELDQSLNNQDIFQAQEAAREKAKLIKLEESQNTPQPNDQDKISNSQNNIKNEQSSSNLKKSKTNRKIKILTFVGVNSILLNVFLSGAVGILSIVPFLILAIILANFLTFLALYKGSQIKILYLVSYLSIISASKALKKGFSKRRILISLCVLLFAISISLNIFSIVKNYQLSDQIKQSKSENSDALHYISKDLQYSKIKYSSDLQDLKVELKLQEQINSNKMRNITKQYEQIIYDFQNNAQSQIRQIELLKKEINELKSQMQSIQNQDNLQQQSRNDTQQNKKEFEQPEYPRIKKPIRDQPYTNQRNNNYNNNTNNSNQKRTI